MNNGTTQDTKPAAPPPQAPSVALAPPVPTEGEAISAFASASNFATAQRIARSLSMGTIVPDAYRGEASIANCVIALEIASRIGASVVMVMQSLDIVQGRPSWRASFLIATVNSSRRFSPLRFRWEGAPNSDGWGCRAVAKDREGGEECLGALITIGLAKAEGWYSRNGSKWRTMPEQMIMYRAAAFWTRVYAPELSLGMQTSEEAIDVAGELVSDDPVPARALPAGRGGASASDLEAALRESPAPAPAPTTTPAPPPSDPAPNSPAGVGFTKPSAAADPRACVTCGKPIPPGTGRGTRGGMRHNECAAPAKPKPADEHGDAEPPVEGREPGVD